MDDREKPEIILIVNVTVQWTGLDQSVPQTLKMNLVDEKSQ